VGVAESGVFISEKILIRILPTKPPKTDLFDFYPKLSLIENYINERPTFAIQDQYFTPKIFKIASLKRANAPMSVNSLSETIFLATKELRDVIFLISADTKKMLTNLAAELSRKLLNYRNNTHLTENIKIGDYIIIPDRLILKNFSSIHSAIARGLDVEGRYIKLRLANNHIITQQVTDLFNFDSHHPTKYTLDILDLPLFKDNDDVTRKSIRHPTT